MALTYSAMMFFYNSGLRNLPHGGAMATLNTRKTLYSLSLSVGLLLGFTAHAAQPGQPSEAVGEVTSVIGNSRVINTRGEQAAVRGLLIRAGDKIETNAGGHVHVRFADGGLVSVRPLSRLHIEDYRNADAQNLAAIKFRLDEGVVRSVTGQWGEANRDRFRLNTPVAAIGIKGTDFVVKAQGVSTLASVNTGAIVMAPLEGACIAGLGPCADERSILLSADMQGKMAEYLKQGEKSAPRLVPYVDLLARGSGGSVMADQRHSEIPTGEVAGKANPKSDEVASKIIDTQGKNAPGPLVWLHNELEWNVPSNTISTRFDEASAAGRKVVIGNFFINLYRDETTAKEFAPQASSASFNLTSASANYVPVGDLSRGTEKVSISDAKLTVNFSNSTMATQMNLSSPSLGKEPFAASANVTSQGLFVSNTTNQQMAGAFSNDGRQAGYLFEKRLNTGTVSGLTLWGP